MLGHRRGRRWGGGRFGGVDGRDLTCLEEEERVNARNDGVVGWGEE